MMYNRRQGNASRKFTHRVMRALQVNSSCEDANSVLYDRLKELDYLLRKSKEFQIPASLREELEYKRTLVNDCLVYNMGLNEDPVICRPDETPELPWEHPFGKEN